MGKVARAYVRFMDATSRVIGSVIMFLVFGMIGILSFETISRTIFNRPWIWTVETAQFVMAAYYLLGGGWSLMIGGQVRMDLLYGKWSTKRKALADVLTTVVLVFYLAVLLHGGIKGVLYSLKYKQVTYTAWAPQVAPIKIIMTIGIILMLLQSIAEFIKDVAAMRGKAIT